MAALNSADPVSRVLERAFAPLDKRALGVALGLTSALIVFLVTAFHIVVEPEHGPPIGLLSQYFYGYDLTWKGALAGAWWALVAGFAAGWFFAFLRNFVLATWIFLIRTKASLTETSDFLDHI